MREEGAHLAVYLLPQLWPLISAFLCANREEIPCHESPILVSWLQFHSCSPPRQEGRSRLHLCIKASLLHFKVSKIEVVDFRRLLVHTPYVLSSLPQKCPSLAISTEQAGEGKASPSAFQKGVTSLPPGKRILSKTVKSRELCGWRVSSLRDNGDAVFQASWELGRRRACPQPQDIAFTLESFAFKPPFSVSQQALSSSSWKDLGWSGMGVGWGMQVLANACVPQESLEGCQ